MVDQRIVVPLEANWRNGIAFGLGSLDFDLIFLAAKVYDSFGGVFECHCPASLANCDALWTYALWIEERLANVVMRQDRGVVARTKGCKDANELACLLVVVLTTAQERADRFGNYKLWLNVITERGNIPKQGYIRLPVVYECRASRAVFVDHVDMGRGNVTAFLRDFLQRGKRVLGVEVEHLSNTLCWKSVPEQGALQTCGDEFEGERRFPNLRRADHEGQATGLEPGVNKVVFGF